MDFLSHEGGMTGWALEYIKLGLTLACNSPEATADFRNLAESSGADPKLVIYLPNYYKIDAPANKFMVLLWKVLRSLRIYGTKPKLKDGQHWNVGCYGAIRPLKNHIHQAAGAILAADTYKLKLRFHVNGTRLEGKAEPILKALRVLFEQHPQHQLVEDPWLDHEDFLVETSKLDILSQVSMSETFNIVAADAIKVGVPVLGSEQIPFLPNETTVGTQRPEKIGLAMYDVWMRSGNGYLQGEQQWLLYLYGEAALYEWAQYFKGTCVNC
jgi:hypothetical protein